MTANVPGATEPLTPKEEAFVRREVASLRDGQSHGVHLKNAENVACRLLATLDAERARAEAAG